jgi:hypothetical protein
VGLRSKGGGEGRGGGEMAERKREMDFQNNYSTELPTPNYFLMALVRTRF